jgi:hypothetical protein
MWALAALRSKTMTMNENVHKMRAQILNLRSAGIACGTAIHYFPPCGKPGGDHLQCPEARAAMRQIYENMKELLLSARMALAAVFHPDPERWDFLWELNENTTCLESDMAKSGQFLYPDQDEFIRCWGEMDNDMMGQLGGGFSKKECELLTAKGAWQNGPRLHQVLHLLKYLENQIAKQFDLFDSVLYSGLLGDCNVGKWAEKKKAASA